MSLVSKKVFWWYAFILTIPLVLGVVFLFDPETVWFIPVPIMLIAAMAWLISHTGKARLQINGSSLSLRGEYGKSSYAKHELLLTEARVVNLNLETEKPLRPAWRKLGTGIQGYSAGRFWLMNKREAILYISDWQQVLYVPTTKDHSLLFSSPQAETILEKLRAMP
jgi:Bacterial PH domain